MKTMSMKPFFGSIALAALASALVIPSYSATLARRGASAIDQARIEAAGSEPQNWLTHGGTYDEQRYATLTQIRPDNVNRLGLAWSFDLDTNRGQEATPIVVDGTMYISTAWSKVFALDARTGKPLWKFDPQVDGKFGYKVCCDVINRGVAVWKGHVFVGTIDGRLISIDARTGKQAWSVQTTDRSQPYSITGAPRVFHDKVVIGNGGADLCCTRGYVTAYDTATGKQVWRFYTVPGDPAKGPDHAASDPILAKASSTWFGKWYEHGGGGNAWDSIVYDKDFNQIYIGAGNGGPWNRMIRSEGKGDNLFLGSVVAIDADTGAYRWHYQETPGDSWDYTSTSPIMLATLPIGGQPRKVIMHAPKNGYFYIIDRKTGTLLSAKNFVPTTWADGINLRTGRPNFTPNAFYEKEPFVAVPFALGAHDWQPMSYSPRTGLVYIPAQQQAAVYAQDPDFKFVTDRHVAAVIRPNVENLPPTWGALIAWDPLRQQERWRVPQAGLWNGGTLATATDLVFAGTGHGEFNAYSAIDGKTLWSFDAQTGVIAGPVTYSIGGEQYVAVLAGLGGSYAMGRKIAPQRSQPQANGRVLVFKLGGTARLAPERLDLAPPNPSDESFAPAQTAAGEALYAKTCASCHGGSILPDLRRSSALPDKSAWQGIVIGGALQPRGMISFARFLKPEDAEAIRAYLNTQARALRDGKDIVETPLVK